MNLKYTALLAAMATASTSAFMSTSPTAFRNTALKGLADDDIESQIQRAVSINNLNPTLHGIDCLIDWWKKEIEEAEVSHGTGRRMRRGSGLDWGMSETSRIG